MSSTWWKEAVVYQIYPKSYYDSNGDGIGDLAGITEKLDYIQSLGTNVIWLCPIFKSPMKDNGYDIADYSVVDTIFGDNSALDTLISEAKKRDIKILLDLVLNHSSNEHPWFKAALADPDSPYADYYIFKHWDKPTPPNNLRTYFDCSVWTRIPNSNRWYFNSFGPEQPDLNWENPQLRKEIIDMINMWIKKGVAGFRIDAIGNLKKSPESLSEHRFEADREDGSASLVPWVLNQPGIDKFLTELADKTFKPANSMTVAEIDVPEKDLLAYVGENGYFSMVFDFSIADLDIRHQKPFTTSPITGESLKPVFIKSQLDTQRIGWGAPYLENHDQPRSLNKFLPKGAINSISAKMLATFLLTQRGTPFIYQGQEIGMTNCSMTLEEHDDLHVFKLIEWGRREGYSDEQMMEYFNLRSRDNSRTPFQWNDKDNGGFTTGKPWLKVNPNYVEINAEQECSDKKSLFSYYQQLIALRRHSDISDILIYGDFIPLDSPSDVIAFKRQHEGKMVNIYCNFSGEEKPLSINEQQIYLHNSPIVNDKEGKIILQPYQAIIMS
ncbi:alpha-glucosidase [Proteus myxofaciens]|uniref:Family 13 glycosyl hydrolase n=1 Tax=Proteus myxofaciens ATCC 19692 TaxID=1354337 RepID=A0A198G0R1_9GAMM|nr:alpha-glucosidase [Proteus myxofaciens]OAT30922.1 family 13 glycosyl hydrolase [Proteus myxofaciens ATCC 19692]